MANPTTPLKLLIDTENQKVLFAEATKDFIDFQFTILHFPLGEIASTFPCTEVYGNNYAMVTCLENLIFSMNTLTPDYRLPKGLVEVPISTSCDTLQQFILQYIIESSSTYTLSFYRCSSCDCFTLATCPKCKSGVNKPVYFLPSSDKGGYVKEGITYTVTDDLIVKPMSAISSIISLKKSLDINNFASLEEKEVCFGKDEAMKLVNLMWQSNRVLTGLFLGNVDKK